MDYRKSVNAFLVAILTVACFAAPASAQLHEDLHDVFKAMFEDLDEDIRANFQKALDNDSAEVEFTADQLKRFRANPVNPFEGIEDVDLDKIRSNVILKFEIPSMRNRTRNSLEKQHPATLKQFRPAIESASKSVVAVKSKGKQIVLGIVVDNRGLILTKASELKNRENIVCELSGGEILSAKILKQDETNDLAVLEINAKDLTPINWSDEQPLPGAFVVTPGHKRNSILLGVYSVTARSTVNGQQAFLGVRPQTTSQGIRIGEVTPDTAAYAAGLKDGDIITKFEGVPMREVSDLVNIIRKHKSGDVVTIEYLRGNNAAVAQASLAGRNLSGERAAEFKMMNRLGAIPSRRADGFPVVFQHDTPLFPEQCGGPIVDLKGNVIGMNIARQGRAASYAIPSSHVERILEDLLREDIAKRQ